MFRRNNILHAGTRMMTGLVDEGWKVGQVGGKTARFVVRLFIGGGGKWRAWKGSAGDMYTVTTL